MSYRERFNTIILVVVLHVLGALSAFANQHNSVMTENQLGNLYTEMSNLPSEKLVKMGEEMFRERQEFDSAMVCFSVVTNRYKQSMSKEEKAVCMEAFNVAGYVCCYFYYDYTRAYDMLSEAKKIGEKYLPGNPLICRTYMNCGNLFVTSGLHYDSDNLLKTSIDYFQKCLKKCYELKDWEMYVKCYIYLSSFLARRSEYEALKTCVTDEEFKSVPVSTPNYEAFKCFYNAAQNNAAKRYSVARQYLLKSYGKVVDSNTPYRYKTLTLSTIAHTYEMDNNLDSALALYDKILSIAEEYRMVDVIAATYGFIANDYKMSGDEDNYFKYYTRYVQVKDSLLTVSGLEDVGEKHFLMKVKEEADKAAELHKHNQNMIVIVILLAVVAVVLVGITLLILRKTKYLKERNQLLYERVQNVLRRDQEQECAVKKYQSSCLTEEDKVKISADVKRVMTQPDVICKPTFNLDELAQTIGVNSRYVSQVINECYGKNFSSYLAEQRVKEACKRFDDTEAYGNLTIEAVAQSVGFRSRNSLITAFKRITGLTPSEYQKVSKDK